MKAIAYHSKVGCNFFIGDSARILNLELCTLNHVHGTYDVQRRQFNFNRGRLFMVSCGQSICCAMMVCISGYNGYLTYWSQGTSCNSRGDLWVLGKMANGLGLYTARVEAEGNACTRFGRDSRESAWVWMRLNIH